MSKGSILLIGFHNQKALGVRYLEKALKSSDFAVNIVFFKAFNSVNPNPATAKELELLKNIIADTKPDMIGLSVMSSLYIETVYSVNNMLKENFNIPILWGGVFVTLFPDKCLEHADFVIRGEGEKSIVELMNSIVRKADFQHIKNLGFKKAGEAIVNDMYPLMEDLDEYGYPKIGGDNKYFINNNTVTKGDPQINSLSYELTASRGCPFVCSYCSAVNLRRSYSGKGNFVRFRSVARVMDELHEAKAKIKRLKVIHFWDEIFSDDQSWIDEFTYRYKKEINLPFEIWGHPLKTDKALIEKLVKAGLYKVVMGIQSGSPYIRKEIFHRPEKQEDIIKASEVLRDCKVPQVIYDFMLQHPFETDESMRETYELCTRLAPPFELQLHGLNFLPGTDIVDLAIKQNVVDKEELEKIMNGTMQEQYDAYWKLRSKSELSGFWYSLIYLTQFSTTRSIATKLAADPTSEKNKNKAKKLYKMSQPLSKIRYYYKKGRLVLKSI